MRYIVKFLILLRFFNNSELSSIRVVSSLLVVILSLDSSIIFWGELTGNFSICLSLSVSLFFSVVIFLLGLILLSGLTELSWGPLEILVFGSGSLLLASLLLTSLVGLLLVSVLSLVKLYAFLIWSKVGVFFLHMESSGWFLQ